MATRSAVTAINVSIVTIKKKVAFITSIRVKVKKSYIARSALVDGIATTSFAIRMAAIILAAQNIRTCTSGTLID